jgi:hypothetical protein
MEFRTVCSPDTPDVAVNQTMKLFSFGSCFSDSIHSHLSDWGFESKGNPFGVVFHPEAIAHLFERIAEDKMFHETDFFNENGLWKTFEAQSGYFGDSLESVLNQINNTLTTARFFLEKANLVIVTLGTSWGYKVNQTGKIAANCHRQANILFTKVLSSPESIFKNLDTIYRSIQAINPQAKICFTVSPVRHLKDGFQENSASKGILNYTLYTWLQKNKLARYFPAYELLTDDLRDYRFYAEDMIHPSPTGEKYIMENFKNVWLTQEAKQIAKDCQQLYTMLRHKPTTLQGVVYDTWIKSLNEKMEFLSGKAYLEPAKELFRKIPSSD